MSSNDTTRPDSVVSSQDAETQECTSWSQKYSDEKAEKLKLAGSSSKTKCEIQSLKDRCKKFSAELESRDKEIITLSNDLSATRERLRNSQVPSPCQQAAYQPARQAQVDEGLEAELRATRELLDAANESYAKLANLHKDIDCEAFRAFSQRQTTWALEQSTAASEDLEAYIQLGETNKMLQEENAALSAQLIAAFEEADSATSN
ncbi:hypothetical protein EK21DRAFT_112700 [Setomelanomma holmii]|uniref:Uncharacterized protein n=1 Tax=Setomelanomma holmii TaxID=210430 RepID=A0A9P4H8K3_9PLEO|nr:hypothetical protein EK21DRAFT_112700 [Setomelanomma holmii]